MQVRPPGAPHRFFSWGMTTAVFAVTLACYWPSLHGLQLWDDPAHVTRPDLRSWAGLYRIFFEPGATQEFYPVLHGAFWLEHRLWGDAVLGYHLLNVVLHAGSCCLLALVLRQLGSTSALAATPAGARRVELGAWFGAFLFAVHPVCVESVAWITEQKNTLSLFLYLLTAWLYLGHTARPSRTRYGLALGCFFLALAAKPATVTLPPALLVAAWWRYGRIEWRRDVRPLLPWFALAVTIGLVTVWAESHFVGAQGAPFEMSPAQRLLLAGRVVWFYLGKLVWPVDLIFFYPRYDVTQASAWWGFLAASLAVTVALWALRHRRRGPLAAWLFFVGSLFPVLGFFNLYGFLFSQVADHFQYMGCFAAVAALGSAAAVAAPSLSVARLRLLAASAIGLLALLAAQSWRQAGLYQNNEVLFRTTIARNPDSWMAHQILATTLAQTPGRAAESIPHYEAVLRLNPGHPDAYLGLGIELAKDPARKGEVIGLYERAVQLRPTYVEVRNNLGLELSRAGRLPEAISQFEAVLRLNPRFAEAHANLAGALARTPGREAEAHAHYTEALRISPALAWVHHNFALYLVRSGRRPEALAQCQEAVRLRPEFFEARNSLGILYAQQGRFADARAQWEEALRLNPGFAEARRNLSLLAQLPGS